MSEPWRERREDLRSRIARAEGHEEYDAERLKNRQGIISNHPN